MINNFMHVLYIVYSRFADVDNSSNTHSFVCIMLFYVVLRMKRYENVLYQRFVSYTSAFLVDIIMLIGSKLVYTSIFMHLRCITIE